MCKAPRSTHPIIIGGRPRQKKPAQAQVTDNMCRAIVAACLRSIVLLCLLATNDPGRLLMVLGCSEVATKRIGPFFRPFVGSPVPQSLKTTGADPSILLGTVSIWDGAEPGPRELNITIDIASGNVQAGWPGNAVPTELPATLADPSGGYDLHVLQVVNNGIYVALGPRTNNSNSSSSPTSSSALPILIELQLPTGFVLDDPTRDVYFMVHAEENLAMIFYPGSTDCLSNPAYTLCASACPPDVACFLEENFAALVDLAQRRIVRRQSFTSRRGIYVLNPGPSNSLSTVWPTLGILNLGFFDSCGGSGYLAYNESGVIGEVENFDPGYLSAVAVGRDKEAYVVTEHAVFEEEDQRLYVKAFELRRINLVTGETLDSVFLNAHALWSLSNVQFPGVVATTPRPTPATAAQGTAPPSAEDDQEPTRAPFPTIFIQLLPPSPPAPPPVGRAPSPTIAINVSSSARPTVKDWGKDITTHRPSSTLFGSSSSQSFTPTRAIRPEVGVPTTTAPLFSTSSSTTVPPTSAPFPTVLLVWRQPPEAPSTTTTTVAPVPPPPPPPLPTTTSIGSSTDGPSTSTTATPARDNNNNDTVTSDDASSSTPILTVSNFTIQSNRDRPRGERSAGVGTTRRCCCWGRLLGGGGDGGPGTTPRLVPLLLIDSTALLLLMGTVVLVL